MQKIRLARANDLMTLVALDKITSMTSWSIDNYTSSLHNLQHKIYVLESADQIIGALVLGKALDEGEILQFWIKKEEQKKGFGLTLLQQGLNFFKKNQVVNVFLEVRSDNVNAIKLYEKLGFIRAGIRKNYYKVESWTWDAIIMLKNLM